MATGRKRRTKSSPEVIDAQAIEYHTIKFDATSDTFCLEDVLVQVLPDLKKRGKALKTFAQKKHGFPQISFEDGNKYLGVGLKQIGTIFDTLGLQGSQSFINMLRRKSQESQPSAADFIESRKKERAKRRALRKRVLNEIDSGSANSGQLQVQKRKKEKGEPPASVILEEQDALSETKEKTGDEGVSIQIGTPRSSNTVCGPNIEMMDVPCEIFDFGSR